MNLTFSANPSGMTTLSQSHFIVFQRPDYQNKFWLTSDGRTWHSEPDLPGLAAQLVQRKARRLFALPREGAPQDLVDLTEAEQKQLSKLLMELESAASSLNHVWLCAHVCLVDEATLAEKMRGQGDGANGPAEALLEALWRRIEIRARAENIQVKLENVDQATANGAPHKRGVYPFSATLTWAELHDLKHLDQVFGNEKAKVHRQVLSLLDRVRRNEAATKDMLNISIEHGKTS